MAHDFRIRTVYCSVVGAEVVRDGFTANCVFTFETLGDGTGAPPERFHVIYPVNERSADVHLLLSAIGLQHVLRADAIFSLEESIRYQPRIEDLMPVFLRAAVSRLAAQDGPYVPDSGHAWEAPQSVD